MTRTTIKPENDRANLFDMIYRGSANCDVAAYYQVTCDAIAKIIHGQDGGQSYAQWFSAKLRKR